MGIYLPNMEMPTKCSECLFAKLSPTGESLICNYMLSGVSWDDRPFDCPLVDVPPHGRLGDLDRLEQMFVDIDNAPYSGFDGTEPFYSAEDAAQIIRLAPTIIEAEE